MLTNMMKPRKTPALLFCAATLSLASCSSSPSIAEKPQDAMDARAASMGYGRTAEDISPSARYDSLSEKNLEEYDGSTTGVLLHDFLKTTNKKP